MFVLKKVLIPLQTWFCPTGPNRLQRFRAVKPNSMHFEFMMRQVSDDVQPWRRLLNTLLLGVAFLGNHADCQVIGWGDNSYGQTNVPPDLTNVVMIATGANHNLALNADGTVTAWGRDSSGQADVPTNLDNVVAVSGGFAFNVALRNGSVAGFSFICGWTHGWA